MAKRIYDNMKLFLAGYDITGDHNELAMNLSRSVHDITAFGVGSIQRLAGLKTMELTHSGFWEAGTGEIDATLYNKLGVVNQVMTFAPTGNTAALHAYITRTVSASYGMGDEVEAPFTFSGAMFSQGDDIVRGTILGAGAKTVTGTGAAVQLGAVSATQKLFASLQVYVKSGSSPAITVKIQSDDAQGFLSPTDRITFTTITDSIGSQWATPVAGAINDDWWRAQWTITGGTPSLTICAVAAIR